jgi:hypothetical protein
MESTSDVWVEGIHRFDSHTSIRAARSDLMSELGQTEKNSV